MLSLLWVVPALPLLSALLLLLSQKLSRHIISALGVGSVTASAVLSILIAANSASRLPFSQTLFTWFHAATLKIPWSYYLDPLSLLMMLVVTIVGALIHLYSTEFMQDDEGYGRFFGYMNLFVASMLFLVLGQNLLVLYLGWEGVGLCSYLLIGFWYKDRANGAAARKAFVITRVGDSFFAIGLFLLFLRFETLDIQPLLSMARAELAPGDTIAVAAAAMLLLGACGKSAQLPLQTWLPDAMAGPTPVSALIHAATMVTAGVYLIARTHVLFELAPPVLLATALIGAVTLLLAGLAATAQSDLKRILAYSTISQIGYMFLALGARAWAPAMFHFMTHALFKALLFLAAGAAILWHGHEYSIFGMRGIRRELPILFWPFLAGAATLAAIPFVTSSFFSKDLILAQVYASGPAGPWLWLAGTVGAFVTALYSFRMVFIALLGQSDIPRSHRHHPGFYMLSPIIVLAVLSLVAGYFEKPILKALSPALGTTEAAGSLPVWLELIAIIVPLAGLAAAAWLYIKNRKRVIALEAAAATPESFLTFRRIRKEGFYFDRLYGFLFVRPFKFLAWANRADLIDVFYRAVAGGITQMSFLLRLTQNGNIRWYLAGVAGGSVVMLAVVILTLISGR